MTDKHIQENEGFTLLEVAMVMFIAGIVSLIVVTRFMDTSTEELLETDVVKTHLRYAQARAMSSNVIWGIVFDGSTYSFFTNGDTTDTVYLPGEESKTLDLPSGVTFATPTIVSFDSWGKPYDNAAGTSDFAGAVGDLSIIVTANTGFIE